MYEDINSYTTRNTPTSRQENSNVPNSTKAVTKDNNFFIFRKRISIQRAFAFLFGGLFFYFEARLWELHNSTFWEWTKDQSSLWIGLAIGLVVCLGILIGFKGLKRWDISFTKFIFVCITLFVIYQGIICIQHMSLVVEWVNDPNFLPSPFTGWFVSLLSAFVAFVRLPSIRKDKESNT